MTLRVATQHYEIASQEGLAIALCEAQRFLETDASGRIRSSLTVTKFDPATQRQQDYFRFITRTLEACVLWHGAQLSAREWEDLLIAAWRKEFLVPGLLGGFAFVGGSVERLSGENASEVLYLAEEFLSRIDLPLSGRATQRLNVVQTGNDLSDLEVASVEKPRAHGVSHVSSKQQRVPWSSVAWRGNANLPDELLFSGESLEHNA